MRAARGLGAPIASVLAVLITLIGVFLRLSLPPVRSHTPDEQTYTTFAAGLAESGLGQYRRTVREFAGDSTLVDLPPPTRAGFLLLAAAAMTLSGDHTPHAVASLSTGASVVVLVGAVAAAAALGGPFAAVLAALLLAPSPMDLAIARRAWQDDVFALVTALAFGALAWRAALVAARDSRARSGSPTPAQASVAFFVAVALALLVKETALVVLAAGTAFLAWRALRDGGGARGVAAAIGAGFLALLAVVALLAAAAGVGPLVTTWRGLVVGQGTNDYVLRYQTGSPLYYLRGLAILQPLASLVAVAGTLVALVRPGWVAPDSRARRDALFSLAWMTAAFACVAALLPVKNLRFLSPLWAPGAVLGSVAIVAGLRALRRAPGVLRAATAVVAIVLSIAAWQDLRRFYDLFVRREITDLATPWFTGSK